MLLLTKYIIRGGENLEKLEKEWVFILSLVLVISLMAGCGSSQAPTATEISPATTTEPTSAVTTTEPTSEGDEIVTLRFSW
jgi:hypothetical protein